MKKFPLLFSRLFLFSLIPLQTFAQMSRDTIPEKPSYAFAQVFMGSKYCFKDSYTPRASFDFNQGIMGYFHQVSPRVSGKIMYDVTRTTNFNWIEDTAGNKLNYSYFEGSKYTAYLKMAEIKWDISKHFSFRAGQLLSNQYLTFIDKFWGLRYIDVTMQEKFRFGMPADFGVQLDYSAFENSFLNQFSVVNGEGPFRYQDANGKFIFSDNIQWYPVKNLVLKIYGDYGPAPDTCDYHDRSSLSFFAGYEGKKYRLGAEYDRVQNDGWIRTNDYEGLSLFVIYTLNKKMAVLARYDHILMKFPTTRDAINYYIAGLQYEPEGKFTTALNFRYYSVGELPFVYFNFGLKF